LLLTCRCQGHGTGQHWGSTIAIHGLPCMAAPTHMVRKHCLNTVHGGKYQSAEYVCTTVSLYWYQHLQVHHRLLRLIYTIASCD
jgi:hypothetical protein